MAGGAGTWIPLEVPCDELPLELLLVEELVLDDVLELVLVDEPVFEDVPLDVDTLPFLEVDVKTLPDDEVLVDIPPLDVLVLEPPLDVLVLELPHAHAQSFAKAIRTDMLLSFFRTWPCFCPRRWDNCSALRPIDGAMRRVTS